MKLYLFSFLIGCVVGVIYTSVRMKSPAPPVVYPFWFPVESRFVKCPRFSAQDLVFYREIAGSPERGLCGAVLYHPLDGGRSCVSATLS